MKRIGSSRYDYNMYSIITNETNTANGRATDIRNPKILPETLLKMLDLIKTHNKLSSKRKGKRLRNPHSHSHELSAQQRYLKKGTSRLARTVVIASFQSLLPQDIHKKQKPLSLSGEIEVIRRSLAYSSSKQCSLELCECLQSLKSMRKDIFFLFHDSTKYQIHIPTFINSKTGCRTL